MRRSDTDVSVRASPVAASLRACRHTFVAEPPQLQSAYYTTPGMAIGTQEEVWKHSTGLVRAHMMYL